MAAILGADLFLHVRTGAVEYAELLRSADVDLESGGDAADASSRADAAWATTLAAMRDWKITAKGIWVPDDLGLLQIIASMFGVAPSIVPLPLDLKLWYASAKDLTGTGFVSALGIQAPYNEAVKFDCAIQGSAALTPATDAFPVRGAVGALVPMLGSSCVVKLGGSAVTFWKDCSVKIARAAADASNRSSAGWKVQLGAMRSWEIDIPGLYLGDAGNAAMITAYLARSPTTFEIELQTGYKLGGTFIPQNLKNGQPLGGAATLDLTGKGAGALAWTVPA